MDEIPETHTCSQEEQAPRTAQPRKRQINSDGDDEPLTKRARLTRKNLSLFDKMGKKKKASEPTDESRSTKTTSTTTSGLDIKAYQNGILLPPSSKTPANHKTRRERNARSRETASPTETEHRGFVKRIENAGNDATVVVETSKLLKEYDDEDYTRAFNRAFTGFPKDVGFNNGLPAPQPDFVEGPRMQEYRPFPVDEHVSGAVLYKDDRRSVTLPHLAGEWKGPDGSMKEAELQGSYDGAALVYARTRALAYLGKSDPPGHAEITTFTTDGTNLNFYSHYVDRTEDKTLEYHQYPDGSYNMTKYQEFKEGRRHLRNTQDDARDQSYALRDQLKEHWKKQRHSGLPHTPCLHLLVDTYTPPAGLPLLADHTHPTPRSPLDNNSHSPQLPHTPRLHPPVDTDSPTHPVSTHWTEPAVGTMVPYIILPR